MGVEGVLDYTDVFVQVLARVDSGYAGRRPLEVAEWCVEAYGRGRGVGMSGVVGVRGGGRVESDVRAACLRLVEGRGRTVVELEEDVEGRAGVGSPGQDSGRDVDGRVVSGGLLGGCGQVGVEGDGVVGGGSVDSRSDVFQVGFDGRRGKRNCPGKKQRDRLRRKKERQDSVPEWRRKGGAVVEKSDARKALEAKWVVQNEVDTLRLQEQKKRLEAKACLDFPVFKVKTPEALVLEEEERLKKLRYSIAKYEADAAYWNKRKQAGAVEKAIALEMEVMEGQLSGKYDVFADRRTVGWAKTVRTNSSTGSSAKKTVWSGSGASKLSDNSESVVSLEKYEASEKERRELLKKSREQEVEIKRVTDVAKQLQRKLRFDREEERKNSLYSAYE